MGLRRVFSQAVAGCPFEPSGVGQVLGTPRYVLDTCAGGVVRLHRLYNF